MYKTQRGKQLRTRNPKIRGEHGTYCRLHQQPYAQWPLEHSIYSAFCLCNYCYLIVTEGTLHWRESVVRN